jgi:hypothetical protein
MDKNRGFLTYPGGGAKNMTPLCIARLPKKPPEAFLERGLSLSTGQRRPSSWLNTSLASLSTSMA